MVTQKKPNILWIQTDEQRLDSIGCLSHLPVKTPNIDWLIQQGTTFTNHHVQSPVCVPSRVCELTGLYAHETGVFDNSPHYNKGSWPEGKITFPEVFAANGYVTANFGKYHTPHHAIWLENWHFELFSDEANHCNLAPGYSDEEHEVIHRGNVPNHVIVSGRYPKREDGRTPQTHLTDQVTTWLREYRHVRRPFFLRTSFLAPHTPVLTPEPFYSMYDPSDMDWDVPSEQVLTSRPDFELGLNKLEGYKAHTDEEFRRMRCSYYGLVSHVDQQIGRLIKELERLGELDNTIIVFTSDHGNLMGEYGQFQKGMFYDITTRVPFVIMGSDIPKNNRVDHLTESIDLGPTLLGICGIPVPEQMHGKNVLTEQHPHREVIGEIRMGPKKARRSWIRTDRWSLDFTSEIDGQPVHSDQERDGKLIDLLEDPLAHHNLYYASEYQEIKRELIHRFQERTKSI